MNELDRIGMFLMDLPVYLANGGLALGKTNPAVPKAWIALANKYKGQIIKGTLKVPSAL